MSCGRGERCIWHRFSVCLIFIFFRGWKYYVSDAVYLGGCTPSEVGWSPLEVRFSPSEVFVIWFWNGAGMIPGVLDCVSR